MMQSALNVRMMPISERHDQVRVGLVQCPFLGAGLKHRKSGGQDWSDFIPNLGRFEISKI